MTSFVWPSIGLFCLFNVFVFYQQLQSKNYCGSNQAFGLALAASAFAGTVTGLIYIGYYGWNITWWAAAIVLVLGVISAGIAGLVAERLASPFVLSILGFIGWPFCAYFMFQTLKSGA